MFTHAWFIITQLLARHVYYSAWVVLGFYAVGILCFFLCVSFNFMLLFCYI